jgi:hypothetical protein
VPCALTSRRLILTLTGVLRLALALILGLARILRTRVNRRQVLSSASENVFVPLTVGGGIRDFTDSEGRQYSALEVAAAYFRCRVLHASDCCGVTHGTHPLGGAGRGR